MKFYATQINNTLKIHFSFINVISITLAIFCLSFFSLNKLSLGLWLDETLTAWIIKDDLINTFSRALNFQAQSPFYYILLYIWSKIFCSSETALRAFSFVAFIIGCRFLYKIHRQKLSIELSLYGTILSAAIILYEVPVLSARPYGLATAFLFSSSYFFFLWLDSKSRYSRIMLITCVVFTIYTHWLYGSILIIQSLYLLFTRIVNKNINFVFQWIKILLIICVLCSPNTYQLYLIFNKRFTYNYLPPQTIFSLLYIFIPYIAIFLFVFTFLHFLYWRQWHPVGASYDLIIFGALWIIIPPIILIAMSFVFNASVLSSRYAAINCGGFGLITASLYSWISNSSIRNTGLIISSFLTILLLILISNYNESWREPANYLKKLQLSDSRPVFLWTGLIESLSKEWIEDPLKEEYFSAAPQYYLKTEKFINLPSPVNMQLIEDVWERAKFKSTLFEKGFYLIVKENYIIVDKDKKIFAALIFKDFFIKKGFIALNEKKFRGISILQFDPQ